SLEGDLVDLGVEVGQAVEGYRAALAAVARDAAAELHAALRLWRTAGEGALDAKGPWKDALGGLAAYHERPRQGGTRKAGYRRGVAGRNTAVGCLAGV